MRTWWMRSKPGACSIASWVTKSRRSYGTKFGAGFRLAACKPLRSGSSSSANRKFARSSPENTGPSMRFWARASRPPSKPSSSSTKVKTLKCRTKQKRNASWPLCKKPFGRFPALLKKKNGVSLRRLLRLPSCNKPATIACVSPPSAP